MAVTKSVVVSYSENDSFIARELSEILRDYIGDDVWIKDFDVKGGDIVINAIDMAISEANWFILLISSAALTDGWLKMEATLATLRSIKAHNFQIIICRIDNKPLPKHLRLAAQEAILDLDVSSAKKREDEFLKIAEHIENTQSTRRRQIIYVDRGEDTDQFLLKQRRNRIVFLWGLAGIGKTSFVKNSIASALGKHPINIELTRGHSTDLLARQIIRRAHVRQPINTDVASDQFLTQIAIDALILQRGFTPVG